MLIAVVNYTFDYTYPIWFYLVSLGLIMYFGIVIIGLIKSIIFPEPEDEQITDEEYLEQKKLDLERAFPVEAAIGEYSCGLISKDELTNIYLKEHPIKNTLYRYDELKEKNE